MTSGPQEEGDKNSGGQPDERKPVEQPPQPIQPIGHIEDGAVEAKEPASAGQAGDKQNDGAKRSPSNRLKWCRLHLWEVIFAGFVACFTGVQMWYGHLQWSVANRQLDTMEKQTTSLQKQTDAMVRQTNEMILQSGALRSQTIEMVNHSAAARLQTNEMIKQNKLSERATVATEQAVIVSREANEAARQAGEESAKFTAQAIEVAIEALKHSREASEIQADRMTRQLRAYMSVTGASIVNTTSRSWLLAQIEVKNVGQTHAHNIKAFGSGFTHDAKYKGPIDRPLKELPDRSTVLSAPGNIFYQKIYIPITEQERGGIADGRLKLLLDGTIVYTDDFGKPHHTAFRFVAPAAITQSTVEYASEGNEAD